MPELQRLQSRRETTLTLLNLVRNVKALAAVTIREQQLAAGALKHYEETLEDALGLLLRRHIEVDSGPRGSLTAGIVLGSDQGMCGAFNQRVAELVPVGNDGPLVVMGYRARRELEKLGYRVEDTLSVPSGGSGAHRLVGALLVYLERWQASSEIGRVNLFLNTPVRGGGEYRGVCRSLLPLGQDWLAKLTRRSWESRSVPMVLGPEPVVLKTVLRQWLYVTVYRALADSLVAESGARLAAMQAAENNIEGKLEVLERDVRSLRQSLIDAELLDISAGFEAVMGDD